MDARTNSELDAEVLELDRLRDALGRNPRFRLLPFDRLQMGDEPRYLIKRIFPRVGLTLIWGPPKCGKSFWTFEAMMHVALGWPYRGHRVTKGPVVYVA